jgi:putative nucleotidyltransferase with HDIG domain
VSALYRVRQFAQAAAAIVRPNRRDEEMAAHHLSPAALALFRAMPRYDRRHALAVARSLVRDGYDNPHLIAAALLHDAGKMCNPDGRVALLHRVLVVLGRMFAPALLEWLGRDPTPGGDVARWRRPFYTQRHHATLGADLALQAGCSPETVALIRRHEGCGADEDPLLFALQAADSVN